MVQKEEENVSKEGKLGTESPLTAKLHSLATFLGLTLICFNSISQSKSSVPMII